MTFGDNALACIHIGDFSWLTSHMIVIKATTIGPEILIKYYYCSWLRLLPRIRE